MEIRTDTPSYHFGCTLCLGQQVVMSNSLPDHATFGHLEDACWFIYLEDSQSTLAQHTAVTRSSKTLASYPAFLQFAVKSKPGYGVPKPYMYSNSIGCSYHILSSRHMAGASLVPRPFSAHGRVWCQTSESLRYIMAQDSGRGSLCSRNNLLNRSCA